MSALRHFVIAIASLACATGLVTDRATATTVTVESAADSTLISDPDGAQYALGMAYQIYAGRVGDQGLGTLRRGLIRFDLSTIPAGSVVTSVQLKLYMSATQGPTFNISLHRAQQSWGEGASFAFGGGGTPAQPGDATWVNRFFPGEPWTTPGGNYEPVASATKSVAGIAWYSWATSTRLVSDVQGWLNQPAANYGWFVIGNETTLQSVKRFDSRNSTVNQPQLIITYNPPSANPADVNNDGFVNGVDLAIVLGAWGTSSPTADINNDGTVNGVDLALVLASW
ncbi:MAG: DNRLRE domain-containing protein [Phycisphaerales bacterium]|nr:DNRLRE domain-containing protein [Phycisphaerales bacterium]